MIAYSFWNNGARESKWTYAASIRPGSHLIDWSCGKCGRAGQYPSGSFDVDLEEGTAFPDVLQCGAYPLLIVSERVIRIWKKNDVHCFIKHPLKIASIQQSKLKQTDAPKYFRIEPLGECRIDFAASNVRIKSIRQQCGEIQTDPMVIRRFKFLKGSWDGSDLFRDGRYYPRRIFCTRRIAELARSERFTNVALERIG